MEIVIKEVRFAKSIMPAVLLYFILVIFFTAFVEPEVPFVLLGTIPVLLHIILVFIDKRFFESSILFWLSPLIFPILFILIWSSYIIPIFNDFDGPVLFILQVIYSYILLFIISVMMIGKKKKVKNNLGFDKEQSTLIEKNLRHQVASSEYNRNYYQNLANQYYQHLMLYYNEIKRLQDEIGKFDNLKKSSHEKTDADNKKSEKYKELAKNYQEKSEDYLEQIRKLEDKLEDANKSKKAVEEYEEKNKSYQMYIQTLREKLEMAETKLKVTKENFSLTLRTIEDTCKAINFVIGRVYSDKKGGSEEIRNMLHIDRILYNSFSEIVSDFSKEDALKLLKLLTLIDRKLSLYNAKEYDLFRIAKHPRISINRDSSGSDTVLEVMTKNDNDPIKDYYEEAKEVCTKVIAFLNQEYLA